VPGPAPDPYFVNAELSNVHVVVPARGLGVGKSRLGEALDAEERLTLVVGLLLQTLAELAVWESAQRVHVVTADARLRRLVRSSSLGASLVAETVESGLNAALLGGRAQAIRSGARAVLYLPADLPLLSSSALDALVEAADAALAAGSGKPVVVIAPADARAGTNALLVSPAATIDPHFGEESLSAHLRAAAAADASVQLVNDPALGFDLDTPDDLERLDAVKLLELETIGQQALDALADSTARAEVA
jgi:2-phospho-L-lactate guanylyltransferase